MIVNPQPHTPFNNDTFIGPEIKKLIEKFQIKSIIETGTWSAHTTREFAKWGLCQVYTIDCTFNHLYEEFGPRAKDDLLALGIRAFIGDSSIDLAHLMFKASPPYLFYLDAHGGGENDSNVNPLESEFKQIGESTLVGARGTSVICVHDFMVPGKPWGYNWGGWGPNGEAMPLSYDVIKPWLERIYPSGFSYHYNDQADGACRGIIYIYPKEKV